MRGEGQNAFSKHGKGKLMKKRHAKCKHIRTPSTKTYIPREDSATRLAICGETLVQYAFPRIRLISPGSVKSIGLSSLTIGHVNSTNPPPPGGAPRRFTYENENRTRNQTESNAYVPTCEIQHGHGTRVSSLVHEPGIKLIILRHTRMTTDGCLRSRPIEPQDSP